MNRYYIDIFIEDTETGDIHSVVANVVDLHEVGRVLEEALADIETWEEDA